MIAWATVLLIVIVGVILRLLWIYRLGYRHGKKHATKRTHEPHD